MVLAYHRYFGGVESLKLKLEEKYGNCRKLYTEGKTDFILKVIGLAKKVSGNTY